MKTKKVLTGEALFQAFQKITMNSQREKINGKMVDCFSASVVCKVAGLLKPEQREKMFSMPVPSIVSICFKICN